MPQGVPTDPKANDTGLIQVLFLSHPDHPNLLTFYNLNRPYLIKHLGFSPPGPISRLFLIDQSNTLLVWEKSELLSLNQYQERERTPNNETIICAKWIDLFPYERPNDQKATSGLKSLLSSQIPRPSSESQLLLIDRLGVISILRYNEFDVKPSLMVYNTDIGSPLISADVYFRNENEATFYMLNSRGYVDVYDIVLTDRNRCINPTSSVFIRDDLPFLDSVDDCGIYHSIYLKSNHFFIIRIANQTSLLIHLYEKSTMDGSSRTPYQVKASTLINSEELGQTTSGLILSVTSVKFSKTDPVLSITLSTGKILLINSETLVPFGDHITISSPQSSLCHHKHASINFSGIHTPPIPVTACFSPNSCCLFVSKFCGCNDIISLGTLLKPQTTSVTEFISSRIETSTFHGFDFWDALALLQKIDAYYDGAISSNTARQYEMEWVKLNESAQSVLQVPTMGILNGLYRTHLRNIERLFALNFLATIRCWRMQLSLKVRRLLPSLQDLKENDLDTLSRAMATRAETLSPQEKQRYFTGSNIIPELCRLFQLMTEYYITQTPDSEPQMESEALCIMYGEETFMAVREVVVVLKSISESESTMRTNRRTPASVYDFMEKVFRLLKEAWPHDSTGLGIIPFGDLVRIIVGAGFQKIQSQEELGADLRYLVSILDINPTPEGFLINNAPSLGESHDPGLAAKRTRERLSRWLFSRPSHPANPLNISNRIDLSTFQSVTLQSKSRFCVGCSRLFLSLDAHTHHTAFNTKCPACNGRMWAYIL
eukprot:TRINITY_DN1094_c0_g1_i4.p1 TRINITY_DN1094_c0_g1~~TRINITY_DN1094_c0_g1_i4.p1  ORF type:complete len:772 (+),score=104.81 TRINITY_DN1094_c0_g1_i4:677-2992(+)